MGKIIVELCSAAMLKKVVFVRQSFTRVTRTNKEITFFVNVGPLLANSMIMAISFLLLFVFFAQPYVW
jgi:hypothetical protein